MSEKTPEESVICGETIDHDYRLIDDRDGVRQYECKRCGAEIIEEADDLPPSGPDTAKVGEEMRHRRAIEGNAE